METRGAAKAFHVKRRARLHGAIEAAGPRCARTVRLPRIHVGLREQRPVAADVGAPVGSALRMGDRLLERSRALTPAAADHM